MTRKIILILMSAVFILYSGNSFAVSAEEHSFISPEDIAGMSDVQPAFPSEMRAVSVTPSVDFLGGKSDGTGYSETEVLGEINALLDNIASLSMNTVILNTSLSSEQIFYDEDLNSGMSRSITDYFSETALSRGFYLYLDLDIGNALDRFGDASLNDKIDRLAVLMRNITIKYSPDGIILDGYYEENSAGAFAEYMQNGSGIGYEQWLYEKNAYIISVAADAVKRTSGSTAVGLAVRDVWANSEELSGGSDTHSDFQALFDGHSDTLTYVRSGIADLVLLYTSEGISSSRVPYNTVTEWWNTAAAGSDTRLYIMHENQNICTGANGWDYPDELVKQVMESRKLSQCKGNAFTSLSSLNENREQSTDVLLKAFDDRIDENGLNFSLDMTLPKQTDFRTEETSVIFAGSFDPNFTVYFQGEPVKLNGAGRFYFNIALDVGENVFTFENKGHTVTYHITRTVRVLKDAQPRGEDIYADGGTELSIVAAAYKGSTVEAHIEDTVVPLLPIEGLTDDIDPNSAYTVYRGIFKLPEGSASGIRDMGNIKVYASYPMGDEKILECITGSRIYVNKSEIIPLPDIHSETSVTPADGRLVKILNDNTMIWSSKNTLTEPVPDCTRLPAGTSDILDSTVSYSGISYYITKTGRRIKQSDAELSDENISSANSVELTACYTAEGDTVMAFSLTDKLPFSVSFGGFSYRNGNNGAYYTDSFKADTVYIDFDYVTDIVRSGTPLPSENCVFSSYEWSEYDGKARLALKLSSAGCYDGMKSHYDGNTLLLSFNGIDRSLAGMTVVIDPGHGYIGNGKFDPGAVQYIREQEANLGISKKLEEKLKAAGVNVIRLNTENTDYVTPQRAETARRYDPDLYIAIHCNSGSAGATGGEAYYFMPYSQPLAAAVSVRLGEVLSDIHGGGDYNRGEKYNYFYVTQQQEFPSILAECGFVSNYDEAMALSDEERQNDFAQALFNGIEDYVTTR